MKKVFFAILVIMATSAFVAPAFAVAAREACNGGQCVGNGTRPLDCPSSGGPTCADGETCLCQCIKDGNTYTPTNKCGKLKTQTVLEIISESQVSEY